MGSLANTSLAITGPTHRPCERWKLTGIMASTLRMGSDRKRALGQERFLRRSTRQKSAAWGRSKKHTLLFQRGRRTGRRWQFWEAATLAELLPALSGELGVESH